MMASADGLENVPQASWVMLDGRNFGKLFVRVGAENVLQRAGG
jgi:NADPH-dependent curcumin reductase CurA